MVMSTGTMIMVFVVMFTGAVSRMFVLMVMRMDCSTHKSGYLLIYEWMFI
jgi:hypothetical protein